MHGYTKSPYLETQLINFAYVNDISTVEQLIPNQTLTVVNINSLLCDESKQALLASNVMTIPMGYYDYEIQFNGSVTNAAYYCSIIPVLYNDTDSTEIDKSFLNSRLINSDEPLKLSGWFFINDTKKVTFRIYHAGGNSTFSVGRAGYYTFITPGSDIADFRTFISFKRYITKYK